MNSQLLTIVAVACAIAFAAPAAEAAPVGIDFNWTTFTSTVEPPNTVPSHVFVQTDLSGGEVSPVRGVPFSLSISSLNDSVEFYTEGNTRNRVFFVPNAQANVSVGELFRLGTFFVTNGIWFGQADLRFTMTTVSSDAALNGHTVSDTLRMVQNPFNIDPVLSADTFYLVDMHGRTCAGPPGSTCTAGVRVYELFDSPIVPHVDQISNRGSFELWGTIGSLIPTEIRNPSGAVFLDPFPITVPGGQVPEPSSLGLLSLGLLALFAAAGRRARSHRPSRAFRTASALAAR